MQNVIVNKVDTTTHSSDAMRIEVLSHSAESAVQQRGDRSKNQTFLDLRRQVQIPERVLLEWNLLCIRKNTFRWSQNVEEETFLLFTF